VPYEREFGRRGCLAAADRRFGTGLSSILEHDLMSNLDLSRRATTCAELP